MPENPPLKKAIVLAAVALVCWALAPWSHPRAQGAAWNADIGVARRVAGLIPGRKPLRVNVLKFAESRRTKNFSVKGAPAQPSVQARTAFQVVYADGTIMVDAGMNQQVHRFFGRGVEEPYDASAAGAVATALAQARLIVVTHEHGDHVAGVIASPRAAELAAKTILTRMDGVRLIAGKDAPWVTEDQPAVLDQLRWLNGLTRADPNLMVVASHDDEQRQDLIARGVLGGRFE